MAPRRNLSNIIVSEEFRVQSESVLRNFLQDDSPTYEFPSSLSNIERAWLHNYAKNFGLLTKSHGKEPQRRLVISKPLVDSAKKNFIPLVLNRDSEQVIANFLRRFPYNREKTDADFLSTCRRTETNVGQLTFCIPQLPGFAVNNELISFRMALPIWPLRQKIMEAIISNQVLIICGETGSGKTTQIPQFILDYSASCKEKCRVICTQPRRISAVTVAERVATERSEKLGQTVGYHIRLESCVGPKTMLIYCTNGILLRTLMTGDSCLKSLTHIIVDEIHERDRFSDFLLICLRECLVHYPHLRLILMSATIDGSSYQKYFNGAPIMHVPGRTHPVMEYYLEDALKMISYESNAMTNLRKKQKKGLTSGALCPAPFNLNPALGGLDNLIWPESVSESQFEALKHPFMGPNAILHPEEPISTSAEAVTSGDTLSSEETTSTSDETTLTAEETPEEASALAFEEAISSAETESARNQNVSPGLLQEMQECITECVEEGSDDSFAQLLQLILSEHAPVNFQHPESGYTGLMAAALHNNVDMCFQLCSFGADVTLRARDNLTALDLALTYQHNDVVGMLALYEDFVNNPRDSENPAEASEYPLGNLQQPVRAAVSTDRELGNPHEDSVRNLLESGNWQHPSFASTSKNFKEYFGGNSFCNPPRNFAMPFPEMLTPEDKYRLDLYHQTVSDRQIDFDLLQAVLHFLHTSQSSGSILVFLAGYDDIVTLKDRILNSEKFKSVPFEIFTLHSLMQIGDQHRVFSPMKNKRKIILATNIAETSITIDDVVFVIDCGKVKEKCYDALTGICSLQSCWISQAGAKQRAGRAGRTRPGICFHLFSKYRYSAMQLYATPEILRMPLHELCLQTKLLAPKETKIADFLSRALEPPSSMAVLSAIKHLQEIDALDTDENLTPLGQHLVDLPVEPRLAKMLIYSVIFKCIDPLLTLVAFLSYRDPFILPNAQSLKNIAVSLRKQFSLDTFSDHMVLLRVFQAWQEARVSRSERRFCNKYFVSSATMEMVVNIRSQMLAQLRASGFVKTKPPGDIRELNENSHNWSVIKAVLSAGFYPNLAYINNQSLQIRTKNEKKVLLHTSSSLRNGEKTSEHAQCLRKNPADWLIFEELSRSGNIFNIRSVTSISSLTVSLFADNRINCSHPDLEESTLILNNWINFEASPNVINMIFVLRQKINYMILKKITNPHKLPSNHDEVLLKTVTAILAKEDSALGFLQPTGIGQRPKIMTSATAYPQEFSVTLNSSKRVKPKRVTKKEERIIAEVIQFRQVAGCCYKKYDPENREDEGCSQNAASTSSFDPSAFGNSGASGRLRACDFLASSQRLRGGLSSAVARPKASGSPRPLSGPVDSLSEPPLPADLFSIAGDSPEVLFGADSHAAAPFSVDFLPGTSACTSSAPGAPLCADAFPGVAFPADSHPGAFRPPQPFFPAFSKTLFSAGLNPEAPLYTNPLLSSIPSLPTYSSSATFPGDTFPVDSQPTASLSRSLFSEALSTNPLSAVSFSIPSFPSFTSSTSSLVDVSHGEASLPAASFSGASHPMYSSSAVSLSGASAAGPHPSTSFSLTSLPGGALPSDSIPAPPTLRRCPCQARRPQNLTWTKKSKNKNKPEFPDFEPNQTDYPLIPDYRNDSIPRDEEERPNFSPAPSGVEYTNYSHLIPDLNGILDPDPFGPSTQQQVNYLQNNFSMMNLNGEYPSSYFPPPGVYNPYEVTSPQNDFHFNGSIVDTKNTPFSPSDSLAAPKNSQSSSSSANSATSLSNSTSSFADSSNSCQNPVGSCKKISEENLASSTDSNGHSVSSASSFAGTRLVNCFPDADSASTSNSANSSPDPASVCQMPDFTSYYVIKTGSVKSIEVSISKKSWIFSPQTERKLLKVLQTGRNILLVFTVQGSNCFQGIARLLGGPSMEFSHYNLNCPVEWLSRADVTYDHVKGLLTTTFADGEELDPKVGADLWIKFMTSVPKVPLQLEPVKPPAGRAIKKTRQP